MLGWKKHKLIARRNINNLRCVDDTTLRAASEEELKSLLRRRQEKSEKAGLKVNIRKTKTMPSSPITSCQVEKKRKRWQVIFLVSKITADSDCSHKIKRHLPLGKKAVTNLDSVFKSRNTTWPTKSKL